MNPVRFNDLIIQALAAGKMSTKETVRICASPLIEWSCEDAGWFKREEHPEVFLTGRGSRLRLPFDHFRVSAKVGFELLEGKRHFEFRAWVTSTKKGYDVFIQPPNKIEPNGKVKNNDCLIVARMEFDADGEGSATGICRFEGGRWYASEMKSSGDFSATFFIWLANLCIDFQNPHLQFVRKTPPLSPGKSVQWQRARQHYVFLHKSHGANKKELNGTRPVVDGDTVVRMAHSRRAHFRTLRAARYGANAGKRVWVRSAWVGPQEWTDRSGQIYKIVEPKDIAA